MNLGNMEGLDLATFMNSMRDNDGLGGNNGLLWIFLLLLFGGGNMWNRGDRSADVAVTEAVQKEIASARADGLSDQLVVDGIRGNEAAITALANRYDVGNSAVRETLCAITNGLTKLSGDIGLSGQHIINAIQMGNTVLGNQLQSCCCNLRESITTMGYENRIQNMQQTEQLTGQINAGFLAIGDKLDHQTQQMNAGFIDLKNYLTAEKIGSMQAEINDLKNTNTINAALNPVAAQLNALNTRIAPLPVPAYPVTGAYSTWYTNGCGCGS